MSETLEEALPQTFFDPIFYIAGRLVLDKLDLDVDWSREEDTLLVTSIGLDYKNWTI